MLTLTVRHSLSDTASFRLITVPRLLPASKSSRLALSMLRRSSQSSKAGRRIAEQHPCISMSAEQSHLRDAQTKLKEPTYGFMAKVVKMKISYARPGSETVPR